MWYMVVPDSKWQTKSVNGPLFWVHNQRAFWNTQACFTWLMQARTSQEVLKHIHSKLPMGLIHEQYFATASKLNVGSHSQGSETEPPDDPAHSQSSLCILHSPGNRYAQPVVLYTPSILCRFQLIPS